jgi:aldehyde dehydrogenase family 9 protein A1
MLIKNAFFPVPKLAFCLRKLSTQVKAPFNFVSGSRCAPKSSSKLENVINPATGETLAEVPDSGPSDVESAISAAAAVFPAWSSLSMRERGALLVKAGGVIRSNLEDIARLEVQDTGKPIWEARVDVASCADAFEFFGGVCPAVQGSHVPLGNGSFAVVKKEALGVVGGIGAWNFPMQTCSWKVSPALAAGNTFVYKPSEFTPVTAVTLGEVLDKAGVPPGVYNVVQGDTLPHLVYFTCSVYFTSSVKCFIFSNDFDYWSK